MLRWSTGCGSPRWSGIPPNRPGRTPRPKSRRWHGARGTGVSPPDPNWQAAVGEQRLHHLAARGEVLDGNLYTTPGRFGGVGAGATWLVGSAKDVAASLRKYQDLGVTHFVLSDTPYLPEIQRQGEQLLPLLRG